MNIKKVIAVLLSFVMMFGASSTVFAAGVITPLTGYNLTINNLTGVTEVKMYNLVKMEKEDSKIKYTLNSKYNDIFTDLGVTTVKQLGEKTNAEILGSIQEQLGSTAADKTETLTGAEDSKVINNTAGYYYITMKGDEGTIYNPILVLVPRFNDPTYESVTVEAKSNKPGIIKQVKENTSYGKKANADIGDIVEFKVEIDVPKYADHVDANTITLKITDTMSKGLTWLEDQTVTVTDGSSPISGALKPGSPKVVKNLSNTTITFDIDYSKVKDKTKVVLEYKALLNENAIIGTADNKNGVKLTYTTKPFETINNTSTTAEENTFVYTYGLDIKKAELGNPDIVLPGAEFELSKDGNGKYYFIEKADHYIALSSDKYTFEPSGETFTATPKLPANGLTTITELKDKVVSDANGKIIIKGLDAGDYKLTETKVPTGYYKVKDYIEFTITDDAPSNLSGNVETGGETGNEAAIADEYYHKTVFNSTNYVLPLTGDNGALIIFLAGVIMLFAACSLLWIIRKKSADK